jgi:hypothetical protein
MGDRNVTDLHKPDGLIFEGDKIGHANTESRIRKHDGLIFKGDEIGYVDPEGKVRRPDGFIFKGDAVGQIKGASAHAEDGLIFDGELWGYVDDEANIRQRDGILFRGRIIGKMRGHNKAAALGFYVLRFRNLVDRFEQLEQEARQTEFKGKALGKVRYMLGYVPEFDGLGDFDDLIRRLKRLEENLAREVEHVHRSRVDQKEGLIREAERWSNSSEWKTAGNEIKALQSRWKQISSADKDEERLWQSFRSVCNIFFQRRSTHFEEQDRQRRHNAARKEGLCSTVESLRYSQDLKHAKEEVRQLQNAWKEIGPAPQEVDQHLWHRFRKACDEVFAAAQREWERHQQERERKHDEWERKQREWRQKLQDVLRAKREQRGRLRESIEHDEGNIERWRDTIDNLRPGGRADEIRDNLEEKISDVEDRIRSKERKISEIDDDIDDIEAKLRG